MFLLLLFFNKNAAFVSMRQPSKHILIYIKFDFDASVNMFCV